ncbi:MAG: hypothetical protein BVN28_00295 [Nitrospira sp. ST-bin4]|nr:MAG: hypothetical protein BVN28_00295 [Nitrospira sp. ST-bin4]
MKLPSELAQEARREKVSDPQDRGLDRRMDGSIGTAWWFGHANKRDERIGRNMDGYRAFKMERADGKLSRKL